MILRILGVAVALWLGGGAVAYGADHTRYALTPSIAWLVVALAAAVLMRRRFVALLSILFVIPWLPLKLPAAALLWTGHVASWTGALIAAAIAGLWLRVHGPLALRTWFGDPARAPRVAFGLSVALFLTAATLVSPVLPQGDEPHYLVITQSLLRDHDLKIENNHRRGDYHAYFDGELRPDYLRRGADEEIYSIHAPGLPALVAPAFALLGYPGVVIFLSVVAAAAGAMAWSAAFRVTASAAAAWFGWAAVILSEPFFVQSFMVYPDAPAGAIVMLAIATLVRGRDASMRRLAVTGAALALLPWLHTRAVILAVPLGAVLALRQRGSAENLARVAALFAVPLVSAIAWFAFFYAIYGTPDPRAPYGRTPQMTLDSLPRGVIGLLFDQQFGLLPNAPVYLCAFAGFVVLARRHTRLAADLAAALVPYALAVSAFQMWWAGYTTPARFLVAMLPPLAIPAAVGFAAVRGRAVRIAWMTALAVSALITATAVGVGRGELLLNFRDGSSRLLTWLSAVADVTTAVPSMFRSTPTMVAGQALVWIAACAAVVAIAATRPRVGRERAIVGVGLCAAVFGMIAAATVWWTNGVRGVRTDGGALQYLSMYDGDARQVAIALSPFARVRRAEIPPRLSLADTAPANDAPLASLRHVPAATYLIALTLPKASRGTATVALDRELAPAWTFEINSDAGVWQREIRLPVASRRLVLDADPHLRTSIGRVSVRAISVPGSAHRVASGEADRVARYGRRLMFLLDGDAFMDPDGAWVRGASSAEFAIAPDEGTPIPWVIRTPPVANRVTLDAANWHRALALAPGESRNVDVPAGRVRVRVQTGARPADFEAGSTDDRFLGAWIQIR